MKREKTIYFMRRADGEGPIKIGCSVFPESRLETMLIWSPYILEIIASAPGGHRDENLLHWKFRNTRMHGEWFAPTEGLLETIAFTRANGRIPPFVGDEDRHNQIIALFFTGKTQNEIAIRFGVTRQRVQQILSDNGIYARARDDAA